MNCSTGDVRLDPGLANRGRARQGVVMGQVRFARPPRRRPLNAGRRGLGLALALCASLGLVSCRLGATPAGDVTEARLLKDKGASGDWLTGGGGWRSAYFSGLTSINADNVARLGFAWQSVLPTSRGQESTPVVVDGVMYVSTNWGNVVALDAATGRQIWAYDPQVDGQWGRYACCDVGNRGLTVANGMVFVGSTDNFLHALDAATGRRLWKADTLDAEARAKHVPYTTNGMPQIAGDVVVIGNGGADFGVRGFVRAFDLKTGARRWTFWTVPHDPKFGPQEKPYLEAALKTWDPQSNWSWGGGGTAWDGMAYDPTLRLLYVGTGNSSPYNYLDRSKGRGDNLYLASIVAIDPKTGDLRWHYQTVPGERWDYTATAKMVLADLTIAGRSRRVLMQAPKNGFFYVLDRETGEVISAKPYTYQNWSTGLDPTSHRANISPAANYLQSPKLIYPSQAGGHNWQPMAFNPITGLVYIPVIDAPMVFIETKNRPMGQTGDGFTTAGIFPEGYDPKALHRLLGDLPDLDGLVKVAGGPAKPQSRGVLRAWDPVAGKVAWEAPTPSISDGGIMTSAGNLVVSGDITGRLTVRRADTGAVLREIDTGSSIMAAPMAYSVAGQEYVAVVAGLGGPAGWFYPPQSAAFKYSNQGRVLVFKLGGGSVPFPPPVTPARFDTPPKPPAFTPQEADAGELIFNGYCGRCHVAGRGTAPDLRRISAATHDSFNDIVLGGAYASMGMGSFADVLSPERVKLIHAYISREQLALYKAERSGAAAPQNIIQRRQ